MSTTVTAIQQLADGSAAGTQLGRTADVIALYGKTPIAQQTAPTIVLAVDPTTSGSALVASVHSLAIYAASLGNKIVLALSTLGVYV